MGAGSTIGIPGGRRWEDRFPGCQGLLRRSRAPSGDCRKTCHHRSLSALGTCPGQLKAGVGLQHSEGTADAVRGSQWAAGSPRVFNVAARADETTEASALLRPVQSGTPSPFSRTGLRRGRAASGKDGKRARLPLPRGGSVGFAGEDRTPKGVRSEEGGSCGSDPHPRSCERGYGSGLPRAARSYIKRIGGALRAWSSRSREPDSRVAGHDSGPSTDPPGIGRSFEEPELSRVPLRGGRVRLPPSGACGVTCRGLRRAPTPYTPEVA